MTQVSIVNILKFQLSYLQFNLLNELLPAAVDTSLEDAVSVKLGCVSEKANFSTFLVKSNSLACMVSTIAGYPHTSLVQNRCFYMLWAGQYRYVFSSNSYIHEPNHHDSNFYRSMMGVLCKAGLWQKAVWCRCKGGENIRAWQIIWDEFGTFMLQWGSLNQLNVIITRFFRLL